MLTTVLFDLDDTLVDQQGAADAAVAVWALEQGITDPDVSSRWRMLSENWYRRYQHRELTFAEQRRARVRQFLDQDVDDATADALFRGYLQRYEAGWALFADAVPALRRARTAGLTVAIFTNGDEDHQQHKLRQLELDREVDVLVSSSSLVAGKPDPLAFRGALDRIGARPEEALMIGNSLENDVRGATGACLRAIFLDRHGRSAEPGVQVVTSLDEVRFDHAVSVDQR